MFFITFLKLGFAIHFCQGKQKYSENHLADIGQI